MTLSIIYEMTAIAGEADALRAALGQLAGVIRALPGCGGAEVWLIPADPGQFLFIERWPSQAAYDEGAQQLPAEAFAPLKPLLGAKPGRRVLVAA